jgi:hypothetical protein
VEWESRNAVASFNVRYLEQPVLLEYKNALSDEERFPSVVRGR